MKSSLQVHSRQFLKAGGVALMLAASWQALWLSQSTQAWQEHGGLLATTLIALFLGTAYSRYQLTQPKWILGMCSGLLLVAYLFSLHQTQDIRLMVGLIISLLILLILVVD